VRLRVATTPRPLGGLGVAVAYLIVAGLATPAAQGRPGVAGWQAPPRQAGRINPLAGRPDLVAGGAKVYRERCAACHGADATGGRAPDLTSARVQRQGDGALFWKVSTGNAYHGMPTFSFLPEARRWQVLLYLRAAAAGGGPLIR
jgi:mono/diheme cytochrome c family protein